MHAARHWISFFVGLLLGLFGLFNLLGKTAWLGPLAGVTGSVLAYILAIGGLYVIIDSFFEFTFHSGMGLTTLLIGLVVFGLGLVNVLSGFGVLGFSVPIPNLVYHMLFIVEGIFLMIGTFTMT
ncbi:MAG: hypothetical protein OXR66_02050 [Candidatus Woesearchaeota archaeon]|nr:hypothetical protein [Candidatus Woesearchaeota archaeon]